MEANRLAEIQTNVKIGIYQLSNEVMHELINHIDQQQAEIERLNRAYKVLKGALEWVDREYNLYTVKAALEQALSIKDGEQP